MRPVPPYLGLDIGATSGRAALGFWEDGRLRLSQIARFPNGGVRLGGRLYWDFLALWTSVLGAMRTCVRLGHDQLSGIGVDTWGVDFGLLGPDGRLLGNPTHYRDAGTEGIEQQIGRRMNPEALYRLTGMPPARVSTLSQLIALKCSPGGTVLEAAQSFLMMSDLFRYFLSGEAACELTAAGASQLVDIRTGTWCEEIFETFGLPRHMLPKLVQAGRVVGPLEPDVSGQTGLCSAPVIAVAGHDTPSAAAAVPIAGPDSAFLSCGTWAVLGITNDAPILTADALRLGFVNEVGLDSILFVSNMMGLFLLERLREVWGREGRRPTYTEMIREASEAKPFRASLDVNTPAFFSGEDPESAIRSYLLATKQRTGLSRAQTIRTVLEGLAFACRQGLVELARLTDRKLDRLVIVGGGVRNRLLCQMIADAAGIEVVAGSPEATLVGNLAVQALADGRIASAAQIREVVQASFKLRRYEPCAGAGWEQGFRRYTELRRQAEAGRAR